MTAPFNPFAAQTYTLASSIGSFDTTIILSSFLEPVTNTPYTMALINSQIVYATIAPKTTSSEFISFTGITQNGNGTASLTGVTRGLAKKYPFTESTSYKVPHSGQSQFIISDAPQLFNEYVTLHNAETIDGAKTFTGANDFTGGTITVPTPSTNSQAATKLYVDTAVVAGAPDASTTTKGVTRLDTAPVAPTIPIAVGQNSLLVAPATGTSGGILGWTSTTVRVSSVLLTQHAIVIGGGAGATPTPLASLGTSTTVLHGAAAGDPTWGAVDLTTDVTGVLPVANMAVGSFVGAVTSLSTSATTNTDTTFTCNFTAKNITIYFRLSGGDNGTALYTYGNATWNGTTLVGEWIVKNNLATDTITGGVLVVDANPPTVGGVTGNCQKVIMSITSVTSTTFVVRCAFSGNVSTNGTAVFYPVATR